MKPQSEMPPSVLNVGAVNYLNTKPLIESLADQSAVRLALDLPSRLADSLQDARLDVALIPTAELFLHPEYTIISDACIACRGPVRSVKVFFRVPPVEVQTLALDEGSRTSIVLAKIILRQKFDLSPRVERLPIGEGLESANADAVLLIGDRAMHTPLGHFDEVWDLGEEWWNWIGLPFVFAVWAARQGVEVGELEAALSAARNRGVASIPEIAAKEAASVGIAQVDCERYLRDNLYFTFEENERQGLMRFYEHATRFDLAPRGWEPSFYDCATR